MIVVDWVLTKRTADQPAAEDYPVDAVVVEVIL
jgi:hypothetical protein